MKKLRNGILAFACLPLLATCASVGPDYRAPVVDAGAGWSRSEMMPAESMPAEPTSPDASKPEAAELATWWRSFGDPTLERLVETALAQSPDLRLAAARVAEARALREVVAGRRLPQVAAAGSVTERRQSENGPLPIDRIPGLDRDQTIWQAGFDAAWETDLFGRQRRALEAATARAEASAEEAAGARLRLIAEVARAYLELRGAQHGLAAREAAVAAARQTAELVAQQLEAGEVATAQLTQAEAELAALEARLPELATRARLSALALGVLLGEPPETELALVEDVTPPVELAALPVGERAEVLRRRPDVRAAERRLAAASAEIGVATAELFPRLSISAGGGFQALDLGDLFEAASQTFSIVPLISWRLFDGGRVRAEIRASEARAEAAAVAYEAAVLQALADAERALTSYLAGLETLERQARAAGLAARSRAFADERYRAGDASLLERLDAERALHAAEEARTAAHTRAATDLVALYKALGGGWETPETRLVVAQESPRAVPDAGAPPPRRP